MKILKQRRSGAKRRGRASVAIAASIVVIGAGLVGATPAQGATAKGFTIFYSPNCSGASRYYPGANSGEQWISDAFNSNIFAAGNGQRIRYNAASVSVPYGTTVRVSFAGTWGGAPMVTYRTFTGDGLCKNFTYDERNTNFAWTTS